MQLRTTGKPQGHAQSMYDWQAASTCSREKLWDSTTSVGRNFHSPVRRTIVIKVPREDDECTSGYAVLDKTMCGTKDAAQCFDVASENAMTAMGYDTGKFSPCDYHSSAVAMSVFRHGDDYVVSGTRTTVQTSHRQASCHWYHAQHWVTSQRSGY